MKKRSLTVSLTLLILTIARIDCRASEIIENSFNYVKAYSEFAKSKIQGIPYITAN